MTVTVGPALGISDEWTVIATPVGEMMVIGDDEALHFLHLPDSYVRRHFDPTGPADRRPSSPPSSRSTPTSAAT